MSLCEKLVWAPFLDFVMRQKPMMKQRRRVAPRAEGRVLEVGMGSGLNLSFYDRSKVERLWGLDPSEALQDVARGRARELGMDVEFLRQSGEEIQVDDASFDTVVITWTLCSIPKVDTALREIHRVLRPGGRVLFAEHGLSPDAGVARWQQRLNPLWVRISGGCNMNRPVADLIRGAGFRFAELESEYLPGPRVLTYNYWGTATHA